MERCACPVILARCVHDPHLGYDDESYRADGADYHSFVCILAAMIFTQYVCDEECAGKQYVTKRHLNSKCTYENQYFDISQNGGEYIEGEKAALSEESVESDHSAVDDDER